MAKVNTKRPVQSRTLWFNVLSIVVVILTTLMADETFKTLIHGNTTLLVIAVNVINMYLRFGTTQRIKADPIEGF